MSAVWNKIDPGLASVYSDYLRVREEGADALHRVHPAVEAGLVSVSVYFTGELADLEALGFEPTWREDENRVTGTIALADLKAFAEHEEVGRIVFGEKGRPTLNVSVPDIRADAVWSRSGTTFSGGTGAGALIGIIDTGIDFRHLFFRDTPTTTRIKRIWDQGLTPRSGERSPDARLLTGGPDSYGIEWNDTELNASLPGGPGPRVRHRDCDGHGTHVASIAAGDGRPAFRHIGVAPRAELIVVKHILPENDPRYPSGAPVPPARQFQDAINYVLNVAREIHPDDPGRPVVINCSFGNDLGPHDGFEDEADWLTHTFNGATGKIVVFGSGNAADRRQHARIEFPPSPSGPIDVPLELFDNRRNFAEFSQCTWLELLYPMAFDLYYPNGGPTLTASMEFPPAGSGFTPVPALGATAPPARFRGRAYRLNHSVESITLRGAGRGTVSRNLLRFSIDAHTRFRHFPGRYTLRLTSSGPMVAHLWCLQTSLRHGFRIANTALPAGVTVVDENLITGNAAAANTITVAGYNAEAPGGGDPIMRHSSRGPLVRYGSTPAQPEKPDLAAPGEHIDAARSRHRRPPQPGATVAESGTSMSAPHVAGAIALMFERDRRLSVTEVRDLLRDHVRAGPSLPPNEFGAGRLDVRNVIDHIPTP